MLQVGRKAVGALLGLVESDRRGTAVDRSLAASLLRMLASLDLYGEDFEPAFLRETDLYFEAEGARCMSTLEVPEYLQHCEVGACSWHSRQWSDEDIQGHERHQPACLRECVALSGSAAYLLCMAASQTCCLPVRWPLHGSHAAW